VWLLARTYTPCCPQPRTPIVSTRVSPPNTAQLGIARNGLFGRNPALTQTRAHTLSTVPEPLPLFEHQREPFEWRVATLRSRVVDGSRTLSSRRDR
jgi:hypothetical protein